jgi:hypothetical protein
LRWHKALKRPERQAEKPLFFDWKAHRLRRSDALKKLEHIEKKDPATNLPRGLNHFDEVSAQ